MKFLAVIGSILAMLAVPAAAAEPVDVMVLGTWHFDNPGLDLNNMQSDDVLKPQRQRELEMLANAIAEFKPNKIVLERVAASPDLADPHYATFTPAALARQRDERVQVAYRIANKLGHSRVYAIDEQPSPGEPDYFPFGKVVQSAKANGQDALLGAAMAKGTAITKETEKKQKRLSIPALLIDYNDPKQFQSSIGGYYEILPIGNVDDQPGADLNAMWYLRNAKIFGKLMKVVKPGDRVLVVYGAGHNYWLRHFASETPGFRNVDPAPYLKKAAAKK